MDPAENAPARLTSATSLGPLFVIVNFTTVSAPVVEVAGAEDETETSAGVLLKLCTIELRITYTPESVRNAKPSSPHLTRLEGLLELLSRPEIPNEANGTKVFRSNAVT